MVEQAVSTDTFLVKKPGILPGPKLNLTMGLGVPETVIDDSWANTLERKQYLALYTTHYARVIRYIAVRIGSIDDAEDLASEVFIRGMKAIDSYHDTGAPMEAWVFKITRNSVIDHLRERGRRPAPVELNDALEFPINGRNNPDQFAEQNEDLQALGQAMEKLSDAQRQVLALRFGAEMTSEEVGQVMGKTPGAVREMQSTAITKLRLNLPEPEGINPKVAMSYEDIAIQTKMPYFSIREAIINAEKQGAIKLQPFTGGRIGRRTFSGEDLKRVLELLQLIKEQREHEDTVRKETLKRRQELLEQKQFDLETFLKKYMEGENNFQIIDVKKATGRTGLSTNQSQYIRDLIQRNGGDGTTLHPVIDRETFQEICMTLGFNQDLKNT